MPPDYAAAHTFDSVNLLIAAIRHGGLNRAKIGDALRSASPSAGVTGPITWDSLGSNTRPVALGTIARGGFSGPRAWSAVTHRSRRDDPRVELLPVSAGCVGVGIVLAWAVGIGLHGVEG